MSYNFFMKKIMVISGKQYSGKDTLAKILLEQLSDFKRIGIGDSIKLEYAKRKNLSFDEIEKNKHLYRNDLIELGNWGRAQNDDFWLKNLAQYDNIIIPDVRVMPELNFFKKQGAFLVRVESSEINRAKRGVLVNKDDKTETALDGYSDWNIVVQNNSDYEKKKKEADKVLLMFKKFIGRI